MWTVKCSVNLRYTITSLYKLYSVSKQYNMHIISCYNTVTKYNPDYNYITSTEQVCMPDAKPVSKASEPQPQITHHFTCDAYPHTQASCHWGIQHSDNILTKPFTHFTDGEYRCWDQSQRSPVNPWQKTQNLLITLESKPSHRPWVKSHICNKEFSMLCRWGWN